MKPKFSIDQEVIINPSVHNKTKRRGWVDFYKNGRGWCSGTGKAIKDDEFLYYVRFSQNRNFPQILYTYSEEFLKPAPKIKESRIKLNFMVVPEQLATKAYVPDAVRIKIIDPEAIFLTGILGESGRRLVKAGVEFYFSNRLARKLIAKQIAVEVK